jgi:hypothetical protein
MDSVRFGRVLGIGARAAAKTLVNAVDAATSPDPSGARSNASPTQASQSHTGTRVVQQAARATAQTSAQVKQTGQGLAQGSKRFGEAVWRPFVKLSGVLWLEFTGVFFGIFALYAASGVWKMRGDLHETAANHDAHVHFLMTASMAVLFGYFCVTSFIRASRRGRRR